MGDKITLNEFCKEKSKSDKRVELIGGFHFWMSKERKITKTTQAEFQVEFNKYTKMPA